MYRRALVSGGASGIGYAIASKFNSEGVKTAIADINFPQPLPTGLYSSLCNIASGSEVDRLFSELHTSFGLPDIIVCNAGIGIHEKLTEGDPEKWATVINTNLMGSLRLIRAFVPSVPENMKCDVVFISSVSAGKTYPYGGIYSATKCALETIAETLRVEEPGIRVTTVAPGVTETNFFKNTISGSREVDENGWGAISPEEVANTVYYAISRPHGVSVNHITLRPTLQTF
ncbi:SDR family oxidoreductase [Cytophagaceae bacterium ABcell3]|nr:SDR family oxidoreductase [Cytophagaceae bacterium ABcell3]